MYQLVRRSPYRQFSEDFFSLPIQQCFNPFKTNFTSKFFEDLSTEEEYFDDLFDDFRPSILRKRQNQIKDKKDSQYNNKENVQEEQENQIINEDQNNKKLNYSASSYQSVQKRLNKNGNLVVQENIQQNINGKEKQMKIERIYNKNGQLLKEKKWKNNELQDQERFKQIHSENDHNIQNNSQQSKEICCTCKKLKSKKISKENLNKKQKKQNTNKVENKNANEVIIEDEDSGHSETHK